MPRESFALYFHASRKMEDLMTTDLFGALRSVLRNWSRRRQVRRLLEVEDDLLADIGLQRPDLRRALQEPIFRDPSQALRAACCTRHDARLLNGLPLCCP
jgi:uncharacterized protein YjiS (DUF1127 family)